MVLLVSPAAMAQATKEAPNASEEDTDEASPTVIVSTSKIEQLLGHVTYLMRAVGQPEFGGLATMTVNQYSRGLDRSRPLALPLL